MDIEDCIDYCSEFINVDEARKELEALKQERDHCLWFLAELINERETKKEGYSMPVRWLCLRKDLVQKYIEEARGNSMIKSYCDVCGDDITCYANDRLKGKMGRISFEVMTAKNFCKLSGVLKGCYEIHR